MTPRRRTIRSVASQMHRIRTPLFADIQAVLERHGVPAQVRELHIEAPDVTSECPPGQVPRVVCRTLPNGRRVCTVVCM